MKILLIFAMLINYIYSSANNYFNIVGLEREISPLGVVYKPLSSPATKNNMEHYKNLSLENIEGEIWKDIPEYEGYYQVSNFGRVKGMSRCINHAKNKKQNNKEKIRKQKLSRTGYLEMALCRNDKSKTHLIHRFVAKAFIPNPENKNCIWI